MVIRLICAFLVFDTVAASMFNIFKTSPEAPPDPCYDYATGLKARRCVPDFVNAAFYKTVLTSSECGDPPSTHCFPVSEDPASEGKRCEICDASEAKLWHPARYLTDLNNPNDVTCWQSQNLPAESADNVTLVVKLGKKYELTYISLEFCGEKPESMVIYKSMDDGRSWHAFQYYSSQCRKMFGRKTRAHVTKVCDAICSLSRFYLCLQKLPKFRIRFTT